MAKLILASQSPRRQQLLNQIGLDFEIAPSNYKEDFSLELPPRELVQLFSQEKARDITGKYPEHIIVAADTIVVLGKQILGKPETPDKAKETLNRISGQKVTSITGVTVLKTPERQESSQIVETDIWIKELTETEIDNYVATEEPLDKAGAFAIQGTGALITEKIEGSYSNVVGLPLLETYQILKKMGIKVI
mgnify:CR=1 FL=1